MTLTQQPSTLRDASQRRCLAALDASTRSRAVRPAVHRSAVPRAAGASRASRAQRRAAVDAAVDQDRRLSRGLRLLPAGGALSHGRRQRGAAGARRRGRRGARGEGARARRASAWAPRGAGRRSATSRRCSTWCARSRRSASRPAARSGMLKDGQAEQLRDAGLDYYNHNLDTAPEFYGEIVTTRDYRGPPRHARRACATPGMHVCCGGIVGMGESRRAARRPRRAAREPRSVSRVGADQPPRAGRRHAAARAVRRRSRARSARVRAHHRGGAHHDAEGDGAAVRRAPRAGRRGAGAVLPRRRQLDLLRRQAAHHRQSRRRRRPRAVRQAWASVAA